MTNHRIEPILCHTVMLRTCQDAVSFATTIVSRKDDSFFARTVKVLSLDIECESQCECTGRCFPTIFSVCSGVTRFICHSSPLTQPMVAYIYSCAHLRHLHIGPRVSDAAAEWFTRALPNITHLSLFISEDTSLDLPLALFSPWTTMPRLTHIAVGGSPVAIQTLDNLLRDALLFSRARNIIRIVHHDPTGDSYDHLTETLQGVAMLLHPLRAVCVLRSAINDGHRPVIEGSVAHVSRLCNSWGEVLHRPEEDDVWQAAEQVTGRKRETMIANQRRSDRILVALCMARLEAERCDLDSSRIEAVEPDIASLELAFDEAFEQAFELEDGLEA